MPPSRVSYSTLAALSVTMIRSAPDSSSPSSAVATFSFVSFSSPISADSMTLAALRRLFCDDFTIRFCDTSRG